MGREKPEAFSDTNAPQAHTAHNRPLSPYQHPARGKYPHTMCVAHTRANMRTHNHTFSRSAAVSARGRTHNTHAELRGVGTSGKNTHYSEMVTRVYNTVAP